MCSPLPLPALAPPPPGKPRRSTRQSCWASAGQSLVTGNLSGVGCCIPAGEGRAPREGRAPGRPGAARQLRMAQAAMGLGHRHLRLDLSTRGRLCPPLPYCNAGGDEPVQTFISQRAERRIRVFIGRSDRCARRAVTRVTASGRGDTGSPVRTRQPGPFPPGDSHAAAGAELARAETVGAAPQSDLSAA